MPNPALALSLQTMAVATIYCIWHSYFQAQRRQTSLRERVTYMLWTAAQTCTA